jgi:glycosyltransferase involved in cell wall biosynthesis
MVLLEALALEIPVVSRAVGGIPEVIEDGHSGILLRRGDPDALAQACVLALQNDQLRRRLGQAASRVVDSRFSAHANAQRIFRLYCDLVDRVPAGQ